MDFKRTEKNGSGNATFADIIIIWARDLDDGEVKGFIVEKDNPGYSVKKIKGKMALRIVQNGLITLKDCVVTEEKPFAKCQFIQRHSKSIENDESWSCMDGNKVVQEELMRVL